MNPFALGAAAATAAGISARWNWWRPAAEGLPVLMYHKVGDPPPGSRLRPLWVSTEEFEWQMRYLLRRGFAPMLFSELAACEDGRAALPRKPVLVTFDDGYANNYEEAFPVLARLRVKANIFIVVETVGSHNAWHDPESESWLRMLEWGQISEMRDSGLVDFGSHTMRHRNLTEISIEDVRWEALESKRRLSERLGRDVTAFAYPYGAGAYDAGVRAAVREAGYRHDFGIRQGFSPWPLRTDDGPLRRLYIRGDDSRFDFHLNATRGKARL